MSPTKLPWTLLSRPNIVSLNFVLEAFIETVPQVVAETGIAVRKKSQIIRRLLVRCLLMLLRESTITS